MSKNAETREADLIRVYIETHDLMPIAVANVGGVAEIYVGCQVDWSKPFAAAWWVADPDQAARLLADMPGSADVDTAIRRILLAAERSRIRITEHATMLERARAAVVLIDKRIQEMQKSGAMRAVNEEYQDHRLFNKERGRGVKPYWSWMHDRKIEMVKAVALTASGKRSQAVPKSDS